MAVIEKDMYGPVMGARQFAGCTVACEVQIAEWSLSTKRIDMVAVGNRWLHAVELKVRDWKGALRQAYANLYAADFSHVALWHETASRIDASPFEAHGIGLLRVTSTECETALEPKRSRLVIPERREYVRQYCRREGARRHALPRNPRRPRPENGPA